MDGAASGVRGGWAWGLLAVATALALWRLDAWPLQNQDEGIHAAVSLEMVRSGDWVSPTLTGEPYFRKPPLKLWLTAALFELRVPDVLAVRLPSAISGVLVALIVGVWVARWLGSALLGFVAGAAVTCMRPAHVHAFRTGEMDGMLALWVALAFYAWWRATRAGGRPTRWMIAAGAALGLGFMTKAFAALLPVPVILVHAFLLPRERRPRAAPLICALAAFAVVALPWHLAMTARHGAAFWDRYFGVEVVDRVLERQWGTPKPAWWYLVSIPSHFFPWSIALVPALVWAFALVRRRAVAQGSAENRDTVSLLLLWFSLGLVFISAMRTKAASYALSLYPAALMLIAGATGWLVSRGRAARAAGWALLAATFATSLVLHVRETAAPRPATPIVALLREVTVRPARVVAHGARFHNQPAGWFHLLAEPGIDAVLVPPGADLAREIARGLRPVWLVSPLDAPVPPEIAATLEPVASEGGWGLWRHRP